MPGVMIQDGLTLRPATPAEVADAEKISAELRSRNLAAQQRAAADAERMALIKERAQEDPAFAALVEMTLGNGKGGRRA